MPAVSKRFIEPVIRLSLGRSRYQLWLVSLVHLVALAAPWFAQIGLVAVLVSVLVLLHGLLFLRKHGWLGKASALQALRLQGGQWSLLKASGWVSAEPVGRTLVTPFVTILGFRVKGKQCQAVIFADAVDPEAFRQLRVQVLLGADQSVASGLRMVSEAKGKVTG